MTEEASLLSQEEHLAGQLGGYHRIVLDDPIHLEYASDSFCAILGCGKAELDEWFDGTYSALVHPDDTQLFDRFALRLSKAESCESIVYRLVKKDGSIIHVVDTMASIRGDDGRMRGHSVVSEIRGEQLASLALSANERMAVVKISGDANASIDRMCGISKSLLFASDGDDELAGLGFMDFVRVSDRARIRRAIERAYESVYSEMEKCTLVSARGKPIECDIWIERVHQGDDLEGSTFCLKAEMDLEYHREDREALSFGKLLFSNYAEDVFEVDRIERSVRFICHNYKGPITALLNVRMYEDDFLEVFLERVCPDQKGLVRDFCGKARSGELIPSEEASKRIRFEMMDEDGLSHGVVLTMIPISSAKYFLCLSSGNGHAEQDVSSTDGANRMHVTAWLFGSFGLEVDGRAIYVRHEKARELLALLIEKRGAYLTNREAITTLWECEPDDRSRARYRKTVSRLMAELRRAGIDHIVEAERGARRIVPEYVDCDYYDYRDGKKLASGPLLPEYAWSEYVAID